MSKSSWVKVWEEIDDVRGEMVVNYWQCLGACERVFRDDEGINGRFGGRFECPTCGGEIRPQIVTVFEET
jgi:NAD-dependent SIR2 family protein deacetylase